MTEPVDSIEKLTANIAEAYRNFVRAECEAVPQLRDFWTGHMIGTLMEINTRIGQAALSAVYRHRYEDADMVSILKGIRDRVVELEIAFPGQLAKSDLARSVARILTGEYIESDILTSVDEAELERLAKEKDGND